MVGTSGYFWIAIIQPDHDDDVIHHHLRSGHRTDRNIHAHHHRHVTSSPSDYADGYAIGSCRWRDVVAFLVVDKRNDVHCQRRLVRYAAGCGIPTGWAASGGDDLHIELFGAGWIVSAVRVGGRRTGADDHIFRFAESDRGRKLKHTDLDVDKCDGLRPRGRLVRRHWYVGQSIRWAIDDDDQLWNRLLRSGRDHATIGCCNGQCAECSDRDIDSESKHDSLGGFNDIDVVKYRRGFVYCRWWVGWCTSDKWHPSGWPVDSECDLFSGLHGPWRDGPASGNCDCNSATPNGYVIGPADRNCVAAVDHTFLVDYERGIV